MKLLIFFFFRMTEFFTGEMSQHLYDKAQWNAQHRPSELQSQGEQNSLYRIMTLILED